MTLSWQIPWQFKLLMNFKDNVKETVPWEQSLFFIFLSGEEKRRPLNHVEPLKSLQPEILDYSILLFLVKLFFGV